MFFEQKQDVPEVRNVDGLFLLLHWRTASLLEGHFPDEANHLEADDLLEDVGVEVGEGKVVGLELGTLNRDSPLEVVGEVLEAVALAVVLHVRNEVSASPF